MFLRCALAGAALIPCLLAAQTPSRLADSVEKQLPSLAESYKHLHENPELSHHEEKTSAYLAEELRKSGFTVNEHIGKYQDGTPAWGIVAVLENGSGPRLLIRSDMDALPVEEKTGLDYASHVHTKNDQGQEVGVMHACGHDIHMTVLLGTARELAARKSQWHGTVMLVGQPSEETIDGARAMLAGHLYDRFGKPDLILAEHDNSLYPAGTIAIKGGPLNASSTSIDVTVRGVGAHGSAPQLSKDPILMAAEFVVLAQSIVARQVDPQQPAVLTVGTIHGGAKRNIIPEEVKMGLTLRTYSDKVRDQIVEAVKRIANGIALGYGVPEDRMPIITVSQTEITPVNVNEPGLAARLQKVAVATLGADHVELATSTMGSEDVGLFSLDGKIPGVMFWLGAANPARAAQAKQTGVPIPSMHSPLFAPDYVPTITTGVEAMTSMALDLLH